MHTAGPAAGWVAGPGGLCISTAPQAAEWHRRWWVLGSNGHISLAESPSASNVLRDALKIPQPQMWLSAGSLCVSGGTYGTPHSHPHRETLQTSVCTMRNNMSVEQKSAKDTQGAQMPRDRCRSTPRASLDHPCPSQKMD